MVFCAALCLGAAAPAIAQGQITYAPKPVPFARYVPAPAKLFVQIRELNEVDEALHRAHAWRLLPLLSGTNVEGAEPFDLRAAIIKFLGPKSSITIDDLMAAEMGIAASSWSQLGRAVWFARISDEAVLQRWFPGRRGRPKDGTEGIRFFRTNDGVLVCVRDDLAVMARGAGEGSLLRETVGLMRGRSGEALEQSSGYRELMAYLPAQPLAVAYVANGNTQAEEEEPPSSWWWPAIDRAAIAMYEGDGRIEFAIRASLLAPYEKRRLSKSAIKRLMQLPQTTLLATAFTVDFEKAFERAIADPSSGTLGRYLTMLKALRGPAAAAGQPQATLGPHVIVAWGQDLSGPGSTPQLAVMIENADPRALRDECTYVAAKILQVLKAIDTGERAPPPTIPRSTHLGTEVMHVSLKPYARGSRFPFVRLLENIEPSWATMGNWLVVSLSREHLERILDAQNGLIPVLGTVSDMQALKQRQSEQMMMLAVARAGLATDVLTRWLADYEAGSPSLLAPSWWRIPEEGTDRQRREPGIEIEAGQQSGTVVVGHVQDGTSAEGRLQPGDRIIGVDGRLLDLQAPEADLYKWFERSTAQPGPTLRVQRGGTMLDVMLPRDRHDAQEKGPTLQPADAVRELASLGQTLQFAIFAIQASHTDRYSARLTLRFAAGDTD